MILKQRHTGLIAWNGADATDEDFEVLAKMQRRAN